MKFLKGSLMMLVSLVLFVIDILADEFYKTCYMPLRMWNGIFLIIVFAIGIVYNLADLGTIRAKSLEIGIRIIIFVTIIMFLWGDIFILLVIFETPKCIPTLFMILYNIFMVIGTVTTFLEGYFLFKELIQ